MAKAVKRELQKYPVADRVKIKSILRMLHGKTIAEVMMITTTINNIVQCVPLATKEIVDELKSEKSKKKNKDDKQTAERLE